jgi:hypothetical protein
MRMSERPSENGARGSVTLILLVLQTLSPIARAEPPREAARSLVREGNSLLERQACAEALARFQRAKAIFSESYKIEVNLGTALECLGKRAAAAQRFRSFLDRSDPDADRSMRSAVQRKLDALLEGLARLSISCRVEGARVRLDGEILGQTPLANEIPVDPGSHRLSIDKEGYPPLQEDLQLRRGEHRQVVLSWSRLATASPSRPVPDGDPRPRSDRRPPPLYKRWWFWTVIGAAVVAGTVAGITASQTGGSDRLPSGPAGHIVLE